MLPVLLHVLALCCSLSFGALVTVALKDSSVGLALGPAALIGAATTMAGLCGQAWGALAQARRKRDDGLGAIDFRLDDLHARLERLAQLMGLEADDPRLTQAGPVEPLKAARDGELAVLRSLLERLQTEMTSPRRAAPASAAPAAEPVMVAGTLRASPQLRPVASAGGADEAAASATDAADAEDMDFAPMDAAPTVPVAGEAVSAEEERRIEEYLHRALRQDDLVFTLQPIVSLPQRRERFFEVFSRVPLPGGALLEPHRFIRVAERAGLMTSVDNLLLFRCLQLARETLRRNRDIGFFLNIAPATLHDRRFLQQLVGYLDENPDLGPKLVFELAQLDWEFADDAMLSGIEVLKRRGLSFSMDRLTELPSPGRDLARHGLRFVKVDAALLLERAEATSLRRVSGWIEHLTRMGIDVIASRIENEAEVRELLDLRPSFGQGHLFGVPDESRAVA